MLPEFHGFEFVYGDTRSYFLSEAASDQIKGSLSQEQYAGFGFAFLQFRNLVCKDNSFFVFLK